MTPVKFQVVGEEDYAFVIDIKSNGKYIIIGGTYTSEAPRKGHLSKEQEDALLSAIKELDTPAEHPLPEGVEAFDAQLTIGEAGKAMTYPFFEGALEQDTKLKKVVRLLELL